MSELRAREEVATAFVTHGVALRVGPERSLGFERAAASALLLPREAMEVTPALA